jgi:hypothetical protein
LRGDWGIFASNSIIATRGKRILEARPNVAWNRESAVKWILDFLSNYLLKERPYSIYMGDDETDEDAFRVLKDRGLTILVWRKPINFSGCFQLVLNLFGISGFPGTGDVVVLYRKDIDIEPLLMLRLRASHQISGAREVAPIL